MKRRILVELTSAQHAVLSSALQRDDRTLQLPANLKGGAAQKLVAKLVGDGLTEQLAATGSMPVWRKDDEQKPIGLRITAAGLEAIQGRSALIESKQGTKRKRRSAQRTAPARVSKQRAGHRQPAKIAALRSASAKSRSSKQDRVIALLSRREGTASAQPL